MCTVSERQEGACWCPCRCGCAPPHFVVNPSGLCPDCENGNHEVPPDGLRGRITNEYLEDLLVMHESAVAQFKPIVAARKRRRERRPVVQAIIKRIAKKRGKYVPYARFGTLRERRRKRLIAVWDMIERIAKKRGGQKVTA